MQSTEKTGLNWVAEFKDRWADADALGMQGHRVEHALEPLLLVLAAERDRADRAAARLAEVRKYTFSISNGSTVARRILQMSEATA